MAGAWSQLITYIRMRSVVMITGYISERSIPACARELDSLLNTKSPVNKSEPKSLGVESPRPLLHSGQEFATPIEAGYTCADQTAIVSLSLATKRRTIHTG